MVEGKETEKITIGKFFTSNGNANEENGGYYFRRADKEEERVRESAPKVRSTPFQKTADTFRKNKLIRNTAICAVAALVIWGIASSGTPAGLEASESIKNVISYEMDLEKDLGDLKFVDATLEESATEVLSEDAQAGEAGAETGVAADPQAQAAADSEAAAAEAQAAEDSAFVYPLDGIVTATFAENGSGVIIQAADSMDVKASKVGKVTEVSDNYLSVENQDASVTTYYGVSPSVLQGDSVQAGQTIGQLLSQALYVEQSLNGEKIDPLS
jgi:murein DD-endopeptidase MepM/ murein hydrolase activator NlpD